MEIYNTTTGKEVSLTIIDSKTGCEWTQDLIGNCDDLKYNEYKERFEMDQSGIDWWKNTIEGLEEIEQLTEQAKELLSFEDFEELQETLRNEGDANDYEMHIYRLTTILKETISANS